MIGTVCMALAEVVSFVSIHEVRCDVSFPAMHGAIHVPRARRHRDKAARQVILDWNKTSKQIQSVHEMVRVDKVRHATERSFWSWTPS